MLCECCAAREIENRSGENNDNDIEYNKMVATTLDW